MASANMQTATTVIGYFPYRRQAEKALNELRDAGFLANQLGVASHMESQTAGAPEKHEESLWDKIAHFFAAKSHKDYYVEDIRGPLEYEGVSRERARYFEYQLAHGDQGAIVTVHADSRFSSDAEQIITRNEGDIGTSASTFSYPPTSAGGWERRKIQLLGEMRRIHKDVDPPASSEEGFVEGHSGDEPAPSGRPSGHR